MINKIKKWLGVNNIRNRKVTKAKWLYYYVIFGSIFGLGYAVCSFFFLWPWEYSFGPIYGLIAFISYRFIKKNWSIIWLYISDVERGRLLLFLNEHTHFEEKHKQKLIKWVYLGKKYVRQERFLEISNKIMEGKDITKEERRDYKKKVINLPQQLKDGFNEALLVNALIYAHNYIQVLDEEVRSIMDLTTDHMISFDLNKEYEKCKDEKYRKLVENGMKNAERLN